MPTLAQLREKWFLDFDRWLADGQGDFLPIRRHPGSAVAHYTDGNLVTPLIDGKDYMKVWHDSILAMIGVPGAAVLHSGWRLENITTLGPSEPGSGAMQVLQAAHDGGVKVYVLASRHGGGVISAVNIPAMYRLYGDLIPTAYFDNRFPPAGSNHHKFACFRNPTDRKAILGSIDISTTRWDTSGHFNPDLPVPPGGEAGAMTHDLGVQIQGPAVADVEYSFTERWNDPTRDLGMEPVWLAAPLLDPPSIDPAPVGTHSVQVLRTYGMTRTEFGYSWSPAGEFTVWASYLNAIDRAQSYIYIEDQYFWAPWSGLEPPVGRAREGDFVVRLGEAIQRGVKVIVLVPDRSEDYGREEQLHQRSRATSYLAGIASGATGSFTLCSIFQGVRPIMVHAKLLIVDDEFVLLGSANVNRRSLSCDGELSVGIVDEAGLFARDLRDRIWTEHLGFPIGHPDDLPYNLSAFLQGIELGLGRLRRLDPALTEPGPRQEWWMENVHDPYHGPTP